MMKIGQMASYVDDGLSPAVRHTLARLQDSVPPMSPRLAAAVVEEELGVPPERAASAWRMPDSCAGRAAQHPDDRRAPGRLLRHHPRTRASDHYQRLRLLGRAPFLRPAQPGRRLHQRPAALRDPPRINLGLFAVLGELAATADWRAISEKSGPSSRARPPPRWRGRGGLARTPPRDTWPCAPSCLTRPVEDPVTTMPGIPLRPEGQPRLASGGWRVDPGRS